MSDYNDSINNFDYKSYDKNEKRFKKELLNYMKKYGNDSYSLDVKALDNGQQAVQLQFKDDDFQYVLYDGYIIKQKK